MHDEAKLAELLALRRGTLVEATNDAVDIPSIQHQSDAIKDMFGALYTGILEVLQRYDPIGMALLADDEYSNEVDTIILRLHEAHSIVEMRRIIYEEFVWWFSRSGVTWEQKLADHDAGSEEKYTEMGNEIWELWSRQHLLEQH